ncbi:hypothetical protein IAU59_005991 [Kwoniella sp. CBS 9459]
MQAQANSEADVALRQAAKRARSESSDGLSDDEDNGRDKAPRRSAITIESVPKSLRRHFIKITAQWNRLIVEHKSPHEPSLFPDTVYVMEDILNTRDDLPRFEVWIAFMRSHALSSAPRSNRSAAISESSLHAHWIRVKRHTVINTERHVQLEISTSVTKWIHVELPKEFPMADVDPAIPWLRLADIKALCMGFFTTPTNARHTVSKRGGIKRWNELGYTSMISKESLRGAAIVQTWVGFDNQTPILFGQLGLHIIKDTRTPPGPNFFVLDAVTPNGKTQSSKNMTISYPSTDIGLWTDVPFCILVLAFFRGAFPVGWTMRQLLDPSEFDKRPGQKSFKVGFNPALSNEPVFVRSDVDQTKPCDAVHFRNGIKAASVVAGIHPTVTPQMLRRSGPIEMRLAGHSIESIIEHLHHVWGSDTHERYTGRASGVDISARVHDQDPDLEEVNNVHPDRVRRYAPILSVKARQDVLLAEDLLSDMFDCDDLRRDLLQQYKVDTLKELPDQARAGLRKRYRQYRCEVNRRLLKRRDQLAKAEGIILPPGSEVTEFLPIDEMPPGDEIDFNALAAVKYLATNDFRDRNAALVNSVKTGAMSEEEFVQRMNDPMDDLCNDDDEQEDEQTEEQEAEAEPRAGAPQGDLAESATGLVESSANVKITEQPPPLIMAAENDIKNGSSPSEMLGESPYKSIIRVLFGPPPTTIEGRIAAFETCIEVPLDEALTFGLRPGHAPVDHRCPFCKNNLPKLKKNATVEEHRKWHMAIQDHTHMCGAETSRRSQITALLAKYPGHIDRCFLTGEKVDSTTLKQIQKYNLRPDEMVWPVPHLKKRVCRVLEGYQTKRNEYPRCNECLDEAGEEVILKSVELVCEHLLVKHGLYLPPTQTRFETMAKAIRTPWTEDTASFPLPHFWTYDNQYHADPMEIHQLAAQVLKVRITEPGRKITAPYGLNVKALLPSDSEDNYDENGNEPDRKYNGVTSTKYNIIKDPICFLCANNPLRSTTERFMCIGQSNLARVGVRDTMAMTGHRQLCIRDHLRQMTKLEIILRCGKKPTVWDEHPWCHDGLIDCPDVGCRKFNRQFKTKLGWVNHVVGVHGFQFKGQNIEDLLLPRLLSDFTFATEHELQQWISEKGLRKDAKVSSAKKTQAASPSGDSSDDGESESSSGGGGKSGPANKRGLYSKIVPITEQEVMAAWRKRNKDIKAFKEREDHRETVKIKAEEKAARKAAKEQRLKDSATKGIDEEVSSGDESEESKQVGQ